MSPESKLWNDFNKNVGKQLNYCKRVETKREDGFPDVMVVHKRIVQPIELKQDVTLKRPPQVIPLRRDQQLWWDDWLYYGSSFGHILYQYCGNNYCLIKGGHWEAACAIPNWWLDKGNAFHFNNWESCWQYLKQYTKWCCEQH